MKKFKVFYGLGGSFGGAKEYEEIIEEEDEEKAVEFAFDLSCEEYEMYEGRPRMRTVDQIMQEEGIDEDDAIEIYEEERDEWLEYHVKEVK